MAERYDRTRPLYPVALTDWLSTEGLGTAVDVGCGTGRVAVLLAAAGWKVVGIEPDERMAQIARSRGVEVVVSTFEQWKPSRHDYDLVACGTAWHWVDPSVGYDVAASALRPGGRLAIFRNSYRYEPEVASVIKDVLGRHARDLLVGCVPLGTADPERIALHASEIERRMDLFAAIERRAFRHQRVRTIDEWIEELTTHSPIMLFDRDVAARLLDELADRVASKVGEHVHMVHDAHCVLATRR